MVKYSMSMHSALSSILALLFRGACIEAHGRVTQISTSTGLIYQGWDPASAESFPTVATDSTPPRLAAWSASNLGNIFVPPVDFGTSNITCHFNAKPGMLHVNTSANEELRLQWNEWPVSHKGPVLSYLAACNGSCANVQKDELEWVKLDELGWLNSSGYAELGGTWASDVLISNGYSWTVKVPQGLTPGGYVLRHEIIALHVAEKLNGAQAYPQCVNLWVSDEGVQSAMDEGMIWHETIPLRSIASGVLGPSLYGERDSGILVNIHRNMTAYAIPGPKVWSGAAAVVQPNEKE